ncbi:BsuBI/PstI family type II restriction endonuclease [Mannheimia varigena]|uniref:BsuBI/PstI family type II restriction endonuclease n=1 Tax=Mannheimia varigena TaxID=85404 RepID=UPI0015B709A7|nr:BsuBI/PstI family type II restriction endonuclease [Mannheimia varigena]QLD33860.1 restriction endonuclease [Mannheimia varigena]
MQHRQIKINEAIEILKLLGLPKAQLNERSALCLLALANITPNDNWSNIKRNLLGIRPIMDWCAKHYQTTYAENTRETFRRQSIHQFIAAGICLQNPDDSNRATNSPHNVYQLSEELANILTFFGMGIFEEKLNNYLSVRVKLIDEYAKKRNMTKIPLKLPNGKILNLSAGKHSQLIKDIITEFGPRFSPDSTLLYVGDTSSKYGFFDVEAFQNLGVTLNAHGKLPDVVIYNENKNWLFLIESVTSHGPVDSKRYNELQELFKDSKAGLVFISAFPDRKTFTRFSNELAWETDVWIADNPTHMIHLNGSRFLGPY